MALALRREIDVLGRIRDTLKKFVGQKFNDVTIVGVVEQCEVDGRFADLAVLKDDSKPILLIETKKVRHDARGVSVERRFIVTSEDVVGQVVAYAAILKRRGIHVPFVATANDKQLALFMVPENIGELVDWDAIRERRYDRVIRNFYEFRDQNLILHKPHNNFSEEFFKELLDTVTGIYKKKYGVEEKKQELHWIVIEDLRGFVDFLAPFIEQAIAPNGVFRADLRQKLDEYSQRTGYRPTPEGLAREMTYVLMNKIIFYKVLERFYNIPKVEPLYEKGVVTTCSSYIRKLNECFEKAIEASKDFEAIFRTGIYDATENDIVENEGALRAFDWLIRYLEQYKIEELGDVIGYIYEELIPPEERHVLGQFYTPRPIAELIVKWAIRSPDDKVLDPGCGSGTFLVEAYKRLAELKLKKPFKEIKYVPEDVHKQILNQLYGIDINEFPAHLTSMNLAMKNVRVPSLVLNIFVRDYFTIRPGFKTLAPYKVKTPEGEKEVEVVFKDFDAVVGNPPYTRWTQIPELTRRQISGNKELSSIISDYGLEAQVSRGVEPGIYVYWIIHSSRFLKEGGRLGMIISDTWLQTDYGRDFFKFLLDHYKIHAIIDISARVFPVPLIGTCIVLLERCSNENERKGDKSLFIYLDISKGGIDVDEILRLIDEAKSKILPGQAITKELSSGAKALIKVYTQGELMRFEGRVINLIFSADDTLNSLRQGPLIVELSELFEPSRGNTVWSVWAIRHGRRPDVGGNEFFYLNEDRIRQLDIPKEYLYSLLPSSRYLRFFTFTQQDWEELRSKGVECYLFLCHKPRNELPPQVLRYIQLGEGPNAQIRLRRRPGEPEGRPVSESQAAQTRLRNRSLFFDWYDLGGAIETSIIASYYAQYWHRFVLLKYKVACDADIITFIPRQNIFLGVEGLKALLAYLNSSFTKLYLEANGRSTGGGALASEVKVLNDMPILNVKKLLREDIERLAQLFDRLESEARRLGGADEVENVFGSELASELTGRADVRTGIQGLFNTVIKEIDYEIARILGLEHLVETVRTLVLELVRRRLSRAREPKREAVRGSEEERSPKRESSRGTTKTLDEYIRRGQSQ
jgi:type I restriction-modification system DNA methylase subunit